MKTVSNTWGNSSPNVSRPGVNKWHFLRLHFLPAMKLLSEKSRILFFVHLKNQPNTLSWKHCDTGAQAQTFLIPIPLCRSVF